MKRFLAIAWCVALAAASAAQTTYMLRYKFNPNETLSYRCKNVWSYKAPGRAGALLSREDTRSCLLTRTVTGVQDGVAAVTLRFTEMRSSGGPTGQWQDRVEERRPVSLRLDARGNLLERDDEEGSKAASGYEATLTLPLLPEKPVRVGESWSTEARPAPEAVVGVGAPVRTMTVTLAGLTTYHGTPVYKLVVVAESRSSGETPADPKTGRVATPTVGIETTKWTVLLRRDDCAPVHAAYSRKQDTWDKSARKGSEIKSADEGSAQLVK